MQSKNPGRAAQARLKAARHSGLGNKREQRNTTITIASAVSESKLKQQRERCIVVEERASGLYHG